MGKKCKVRRRRDRRRVRGQVRKSSQEEQRRGKKVKGKKKRDRRRVKGTGEKE